MTTYGGRSKVPSFQIETKGQIYESVDLIVRDFSVKNHITYAERIDINSINGIRDKIATRSELRAEVTIEADRGLEDLLFDLDAKLIITHFPSVRFHLVNVEHTADWSVQVLRMSFIGAERDMEDADAKPDPQLGLRDLDN